MELGTKSFQYPDPLCLNRILHLICHLVCPCPRSSGVGENVDEWGLDSISEERICLSEQFFRFSRKTDYYIDSEEYFCLPRHLHFLPDVIDPGSEQGSVVAASNLFQDCIASALKGNMEMRLEFCTGCYPVYHFIRQKIGLDRGNPVPGYPVNFIKSTKHRQ